MGSFQNRISRTASGAAGKGFRKGRRALKNIGRSFRLFGVLICFAMVLPLVLTMAYSILVLAVTHPGEQTAQYMPSDIEAYATINLRPGVQQGLWFKDILNTWWEYTDTKEPMQELRDELYDEIYDSSEIELDIEADIVPWLGPEIAAGVRGLGSVDQPPEFVVFVGTTDNATSYDFFFDKFLPLAMQDATPPTEPNGVYNGIDILTLPEDSRYCAFVDEYIIVSTTEDLFYDCLDLVLYGGDSLADTSGFQAAQAGLPKPMGAGDPPVQEERAAMVYYNPGPAWDQLAARVDPETPEALAMEMLAPYVPEFAALSACFVDKGIKLDFYSPTPAALDVSSLTPGPMNAARIIPGDADAVCSMKAVSGEWKAVKDLAGDNWADLGTLFDAGDDWPESVTSLLDSIETDYGINLDEDLFSWMNGECTFAKLPSGTDRTGPDMLLLIQTSDQTLAEGKLEGIVNAINADMAQEAFPWQTIDPLELEQTLIGDVPATFVTNDAIEASGVPLGYLFVDDFLVISSSRDALSAVVATHGHPELSLAETAEFQWMTAQMENEDAAMAYVNGSRLVDYVLSLMNGSERSDFQKYAAPFLDPLRSAGLSLSIGEDAIRGSLVLHVDRTDGTLVEGQVDLQGRSEHEGVTVDVGGQQAVSNLLGRFSLSSAATAESATVTASMPGYLSAQRTGVTVREGTRTSLVVVTLIAGDLSGDGVINTADLGAMGSAFNSSPPSAAAADVNQDGIVDVYDLVWVGQNQGKLAPTTWLPDSNDGVISGFIYGSDGLPIADAWVYASGIDTYGWVESYTNADGSYALEGLPEGNYNLRAGASGYFSEYYQDAATWDTATPVGVAASQETPGINFTLTLGGSISGYVYDSSGTNPLSNASINVYDSTTHSQLSRVYTASDGSYRVAGLPSGSYDLRSAQIGYLAEFYQEKTTLDTATPVEVTVGEETTDINFTLDLGGSISGYVYDSEGSPLSGASIAVYDATSHTQVRSGYTASDGSYKTGGLGLPSGSYHVRASRYPYVAEYYNGATTIDTAAVVTLTAPDEYTNVNFTLDPMGSISGTVRDSELNPLSDAYVVVYDATTHDWIRSGYADSDGNYKVQGLPTGSYHVRAYRDLYVAEYYNGVTTIDSAATVSATLGVETTGIDFTLDLGGSISGHVYNPLLRPLSGAYVTVYDSSDGSAVASGYTNWFGGYEAAGLPAGSYYVKADRYGYAEEYYQEVATIDTAQSVSVSLGVETTGIDFTLDVGGYVSGHVYDSEGNPLSGASIYVYDASTHSYVGSGYTGSDGSYVVVGLSTGSYHVRASRYLYVTEYYQDATTVDSATPVSVTASLETGGVNFTLALST